MHDREDREGLEDVGSARADQLVDMLDELVAVQEAVVDKIGTGVAPEAYLAWAKQALPTLAPKFLDDPANPGVASVWLARSLWNVFPVEANGFRPRHIPLPGSADPCLCGSGRAFEDCCVGVEDTLSDPATLWHALMRTQPPSHWLRHARAGTLPPDGLICLGERLADSGEWESVVDVLRPVASKDDLSDEHCVKAMGCLCLSYRALDRRDDEHALLRRLATHRNPLVRAVAGRRLALALHAAGERDRAWRAFKDAVRSAPDDPATGVAELVLLAGERRFDDAEERAGYWCGRLIEAGVEPADPMFHLIDCFEDDARYGCDEYHRQFMPGDLGELVDWIDEELADRELPAPKWRRLRDAEDDELLREAHEPVLSPAARRLESRWDALKSTLEDADFDLGAMVDWLDEHPMALDSFVVLDELAALLEEAEDHLGRADNRWYMTLVERATEMLDRAWPATRPGTTPWEILGNRPALGLLASHIEALSEDSTDEPDAARLEHLTNLYLRLNPTDNHGLRAAAVNRLLQTGRNADALVIAERYADDMFAETCYGRALALHRLDRRDEAVQAMRVAADRLPKVLKHLQRDRVPRPRPDGQGMVIGGEYQAWLYRQEMRETWLSVPGMGDWLKQFSARAARSMDRRRRRRRR